MALRRRGTAEPAGGARGVLDAAVAALRNCQRAGLTTITVADMLTMLGAETEPVPEVPARDPLADPLTGCLPATPR